MNILVLLHPIRNPASFTVNRKAQKIFTHRDEYVINPADKNALEAALRLGATVTAVALGEAPAECLACGFAFRKRDRLTTPGRCPRCRAERIRPAEFWIERP